MRKIIQLTFVLPFLIWACGPTSSDSDETSDQDTTSLEIIDTTDTSDSLSDNLIETEGEGEIWQNFENVYAHFKSSELDTVYIGKTRAIKDPFAYFSEKRSNQFVVIDEGEYKGKEALWLDGENLIIEGRGKVSILLDQLYDNVMWVIGDNMVINNLHMTHLQPGGMEGQNCSGRVIGFDGADNITIINCDLNGCGLAGLHDNIGNGTVYAEYNWIHNNSLGAYTDIDGNIWQEEQDHPVFKFKNNLIEDNGHGLEEEMYEEDFHGEH